MVRLTGTAPSEPPQRSGEITLDGHTRHTQFVKCPQVEWSLAIEMSAEPGRAQALLQLGGEKPVVRTVNIESIDCVSSSDLAPAIGTDFGPTRLAGLFASGGGFAGA
jgi:ipoprotein LpqH